MTSPSVIPFVSGPSPAQQTSIPGTVTTATLDQTHPEFQLNKDAYEVIDLLYRGGVAIRQQAARFLRKRPKELADVYAFRCSMFSYQNILGTGIDFYLASVFRKDPEISMKQKGPDGLLYDIPNIPPEERAYYLAFQENCDTRGNSITDFYREVLKNLLLYRRSWVLIDLPSPAVPVVTRLDQMGLMPYLVNFTPAQVINWSEDQYGVLEWAVIKIESEKREWLQKPVKIIRWYKFDRTHFEIYEAQAQPGTLMPDVQSAKLVDSGYHALAELNQVPLMRVEVPEGMWLANRVLPQVLDHVNADNSYQFALFMSNLAMPVIIGNANNVVTLAEAGYLQLPVGSQIVWTEPSGASFERSEIRVASLREEIYRQMYLMPQGRSSAAAPAMQSGYSKELEMAPSGEIQNLLGDILRRSMQRSLNYTAHVRGDDVYFNVRGFATVLDPAMEEIQEAQQFTALGVRSEMALRENEKRVIRARFPDMSQSQLEQMFQEIDEAPSMAEQQQMEQQQQQDQFAQQFEQQSQMADQQAEIDQSNSEQQALIDEAKADSQEAREERKAERSHKRDLEKMKLQGKQKLIEMKAKPKPKPPAPKGKAK